MGTSREDVGIVIRSALLDKSAKQKFSLLALVILSILLIFIESLETKPLNFFRSFVKDTIYRGSIVASAPSKGFSNFTNFVFCCCKNSCNFNIGGCKLGKRMATTCK